MLGVVQVNGILAGLLTGFVVGVVFAMFRLLPPAPASWAGVAGIVGIVAGWQIAAHLFGIGE